MNKVILKGNLGQDPEIKTTNNGKILATFSLATNERYNDKDHVEWHSCEAWGGTAEFIGRNFKKGQSALIEGKIKTDNFEKDGQTVWRTKIVIHTIEFAGGNQ